MARYILAVFVFICISTIHSYRPRTYLDVEREYYGSEVDRPRFAPENEEMNGEENEEMNGKDDDLPSRRNDIDNYYKDLFYKRMTMRK